MKCWGHDVGQSTLNKGKDTWEEKCEESLRSHPVKTRGRQLLASWKQQRRGTRGTRVTGRLAMLGAGDQSQTHTVPGEPSYE